MNASLSKNTKEFHGHAEYLFRKQFSLVFPWFVRIRFLGSVVSLLLGFSHHLCSASCSPFLSVVQEEDYRLAWLAPRAHAFQGTEGQEAQLYACICLCLPVFLLEGAGSLLRLCVCCSFLLCFFFLD